VSASGAAHAPWNPWANDRGTLELYRRRCRRETEEMTCAAQAAEILAPLIEPGETLLDAGCGGGYYLWSLRDRGIDVEYHGLDFTPEMVQLAREELAPAAGLDPERFTLGAIEWLEESYDTVLCFNVLTNNPHYALGLERLLRSARRRILVRESLGPELITRFTPDPYLDEGKRHIRVYHNTYPQEELEQLMEEEGFRVTRIPDRRTDDGVEMVVDIPHTWRIVLGERA
jgi:SAM-dependent methyltransferase